MVNESPSKTVKFTKSNLWADASGENASDPVLHFEINQWESNPVYDGSTDDGHVSHFTWSSSAKEAVKTTNDGDYLFCDENHKITIDGQSGYYVLNELDWWFVFSKLLGSEYGQAEGAVFLPAAGYRFESSNVISVNGSGYYWSSPAYDESKAWHLNFRSNSVAPRHEDPRNYGYSMRLVVDVE